MKPKSQRSRYRLAKAVELTAPRRGDIFALHVVEQVMMNSIGEFSYPDSDGIINDLELCPSRFASEIEARGSSRIESMILGRIAERIVTGSDTSVSTVKNSASLSYGFFLLRLG